MHRLIIHQLGPIKHCELECSSFMTLTGFQASGKSTIAKAVYYFRTIKEDTNCFWKNTVYIMKKERITGTGCILATSSIVRITSMLTISPVMIMKIFSDW